MPVNYQQIHARIAEIGAGAHDRRQSLAERRQLAHERFTACASQLESLKQKVEAATATDPNLRCAVPVEEPLDACHAVPAIEAGATLLATDGSQINPDRHASMQFGVINVGAIVMKRNSGMPPEILIDTQLFYANELDENNLTTEGAISLRRDLDERLAVDNLSQELEGPVVNLADGTLEIWGAKDVEDAKAYERSVRSHVEILSRLRSRGVTTAGYVDKPFANLVVRLLEIVTAPAGSLQKLREHHPFQGVSDLWLCGYQNDDFVLLGPGERSAVFRLQSGSEKYYTGELALHFFYLNVSDSPRHPQIARVEIPRWVAADKSRLDLLHGILIEQCRMLGSRPYPYLLNRAHEIAVVGHEEKAQIEQLLMLESRRQGEDVGDPSNKQGGKDSLALGRKRYGT